MAQIDTLATARRLEQAGLPIEQARAVSEVIADAIRDGQPDLSNLASKADIAQLAARMEQMSARVDQAAAQTNGRMDQAAAQTIGRMDQVAAQIGARVDQVAAQLGARVDQVAAQSEARMERMEVRMETFATKADVKEVEVRITEKLRSQMNWVYSIQAAFLGIGLALAKLLFK